MLKQGRTSEKYESKRRNDKKTLPHRLISVRRLTSQAQFFGRVQTTSSAAIRLSLHLRQGRLANTCAFDYRSAPLLSPFIIALFTLEIRYLFFVFIFSCFPLGFYENIAFYNFIRWDFPFTAVSVASYFWPR